jgi:hypothetical protein
MADTAAYLQAERWVREKGLPYKFPGHTFVSKGLQVGTRRDGSPRSFEFDAVSTDGSIVALVKGSSGLTAGGKQPVAKTKDAYTDLLFLSLVQAERRLLVLTDPQFHRIFEKVSDGRIPPGVEVLHIPLPRDVQARVDLARHKASREMGKTT